MEALVREGVPVCVVPAAVATDLLTSGACTNSVSPSLVRSHFKRVMHHPSLADRTVALHVLRYCLSDVAEKRLYNELIGLPLVRCRQLIKLCGCAAESVGVSVCECV